MSRALALMLAFAAAPVAAQTPQPPDAVAFQRCAACHLADGKGVPGAFPPLDAHVGRLAAADAGRAYLAMVVSAGVNGPIRVEGGDYAGAMPAQGLTAAETAGVLNHVLASFARAARARPFSADEVESIRKAHPGADGAQVARLRPVEAVKK